MERSGKVAQKILMIVGPTAVGKTALSIRLAQKFNGQVVSGDSMQVYQKLDIGTAKITNEEMQGIPHYLLDEIPIDQRFSVADFIDRTKKVISKIATQDALPMLVGGTGFYLQSFVDDFHFGNDQYQDDRLRSQLHQYAQEYGQQALWKRLDLVDSVAAAKIPVANERRIIRALEVFEKTGKKFSVQSDHANNAYDFLIIGLNTRRSLLYERINHRVDLMVKDGVLDEARYLYENGGGKLPAGKGIGYKEFYPYFEHQATLEECIAKVKQNSRHYAKRQLTWFHNKMNVHWFDLVQNFDADYPRIIELVEKWLKEKNNEKMD